MKVTSAVQLLPLFNALPHVLGVSEKFAALGPEIWKPTLAIATPPVLLIVRVTGALAWPIGCALKVRCVGATEITGGCRPVPERVTLCVRIASETVSVPVILPAETGEKITLIVQSELPTRVVPQLLID